MKKNNYKNFILIFILFVLSFIYYNSFIKADETLLSRVQGKILLQVEEHGEAWYVNPLTNERHYLGRPQDAFTLMKNLGLGISQENLQKIPIAEASFSGTDSDQDGLPDMLEDALGTDKTNTDSDQDGFDDHTEIIGNFNPQGIGKLPIDNNFSQQMSGRILLQVEQNGEAWYVNPNNYKRYFLGRPTDAWQIMRQTGLGISNVNLQKIIAYQPQPDFDTNNITNINNKNKYTNNLHHFSFEYPSNWKKNTIQGKKEVIAIRDYNNDIIKEKKAMITINFVHNPQVISLDKFKTASLNGAIKTASEITILNNYELLKESFHFNKVNSQETTTFVKLNKQNMLMITLFSAGNHNHYDSILGDLLRSIKTY